VVGETVNEMLDHLSARPVSSHPHLSALNLLVAVSADEIVLAVCTAIAAAVKRHTPKHSKQVTRDFQSNHRKTLVTSSYCE
jgi:hypothetical protein